MNWFRLHNDVRTDAKLRSLSFAERWVFICLLCYASDQEVRGSVPVGSIKLLALEVSEGDLDLLEMTLDSLLALDILEEADGGYSFVHWGERQYEFPSDHPEQVRERVRQHRERKKVATSPAPVTTNVTPKVTRNGRETKRNEGVTTSNNSVTTPVTTTEQSQIQNRTDTEKRESRTPAHDEELDFPDMPGTGTSSGSVEATTRDSDAAAEKSDTRPVPIPRQWRVTKDDHEWALGIGWHGSMAELQLMADDFVDHYRGKGARSSDWDAAWRRWVRREIKMYDPAKSTAKGGYSNGNGNGNGGRAGYGAPVVLGDTSPRPIPIRPNGPNFVPVAKKDCGFPDCPAPAKGKFCHLHGDSASNFNVINDRYMVAYGVAMRARKATAATAADTGED